MMVGRTAWMLIAAACFAGCASSGPVEEEEQELLGKPPTPQTDPFFYVARLPASARAESTGMIGEPADEARLKEPEPEEKPEVTAEPATTDEIAKFRERLARAEAALDEVKAKNLALSAQAVELSGRALELESQLAAAKAAEEEARAKAAHAEARAARPRPEPKPEPRVATRAETPRSEVAKRDGSECFSCVKICPLTGRCSDEAEMICGWGKGAAQKGAMLRAVTECNAALDVVRRSGQYSRLDGRCPAATCSRN